VYGGTQEIALDIATTHVQNRLRQLYEVFMADWDLHTASKDAENDTSCRHEATLEAL
jgi:hypothetical protein